VTTQLTVAIPTYNRSATLIRLLDRILPQLMAEDELLVVDDGSQDRTADLLCEMRRVRLVRNELNRGMVSAWNTCLQSALHPWICIIHDDDLPSPNMLEIVKRTCALAETPSLIGHNSLDTDVDNCFRYRFSEPGPWAVLNSSFTPSGATIHRAIMESVGLFDEHFTYSPDIEYFARICARHPSFAVYSPSLIHYRLHEHNYQYHTWRQPDFLTQLEEIETLLLNYSGLSGDVATRWQRSRMIRHLAYMLRAAARIGDRLLLRKIGLLLCKAPGVGRRLRVTAFIAAHTGRLVSF
jgi:glycosyltransferase involved in cell wall biosynthesis